MLEEGREIIGYRAVTADEATFINNGNKLSLTHIYDAPGQSLNQIGEGFYVYNEPTCLNNKPTENNWFCAIEADSKKIAAAPKLWIPEFGVVQVTTYFSEEFDLWRSDENAVKRYVRSKIDVTPTTKTLRFSYVMFNGWSQQMVIPNLAIRDDAFKLSAQCFETKQELFEYSSETIDWNRRWEITGDPGLPSQQSFDLSVGTAGGSARGHRFASAIH
ncbi:hypothetical protein LZ554_001593 [Drepanopeziza brunnea f. sp. 'monogermtubi']|nr:hypothetical protein LZ554_001593 [Drepanopeziza brunnea f. sp. 'monogermtubi']